MSPMIVRRIWWIVKARVANFFTNWHRSDAPVMTKLGLTIRNRVRAFTSREQCCGHPGQPGC